MNLKTAEKIIDELTKDKKKLRTKEVTIDEAIFVHYGAVKFLVDFETGPLKVIIQFARPIDTFLERDFADLGSIREKEITKGHLFDHIEFWTMPENEEEFKTLLQKVLDNYS